MDESTLLQQAIAAARAGRKAEAWRLLTQVLHQNQRNELAWLWLSSVVDSEEQRVKCLENVLMLNPNNTAARKGLAQLQVRARTPPAAPQPATPPPTVRCPHCGTPNRAGATFCKKCGQSLEQTRSSPAASPPVTPCPHCGAANRAGARFCSGCGQELGQMKPSPQLQTAHCPDCGFDNPAGAQFCGKCGQRLAQGITQAPVPGSSSYPKPVPSVPGAKSRPNVQASASPLSTFGFLWRLPGIIGAGLVILAGILPWGVASWLFGGSRTYIGLTNGYGIWSTGLAVLALILLLAIRRNVIAHLVTLLPAGGAIIAAIGAMDDVAGITTSRSTSQHLSIGPYVVILGGALVGVSFVLSLIVESMPSNIQKPAIGNQRGGGGSKPGQNRQGLATASMVIGIVSLLAWLLPVCGLPIAVMGLVLGIMGQNSSQQGAAKAGIVMCIIGLVASVINGIIGAAMFF